MYVIAVANNKGGAGKTTTARHLAWSLATDANGVTLIDLDGQANLTRSLGVDTTETGVTTIADALRRRAPVSLVEAAYPLSGQLSIIPANGDLDDVADDLTVEPLGIMRLKTKLDAYRASQWAPEYAIIDCPPNVGSLTFSALIAADGVVIPAQPQVMNVRGVERIAAKVDEVREKLSYGPKILGVVATMARPDIPSHAAGLAMLSCTRLPMLGVVPRREGAQAESQLAESYGVVAHNLLHQMGR